MISVFLICVGILLDKAVNGNPQNFTVRLRNSFSGNTMVGRLEIYYSGVWGTVCDDGFTNASARVACASLGFGHTGAAIGNRHGAGTGQIWLDNVICNGIESGIEQCPHNVWGTNDCSHSEDISIVCGGVYKIFDGNTGSIFSPIYPMTYGNNLDYYSYIPVFSGRTVIITFLAFNTQAFRDWVTIACESGSNFTSPRYSGSEIPSVLAISSCTSVVVYFHTDGSITTTGFSLKYNTTKDCVSSNLDGSTGRISSTNFPLAYKSYLDCCNYVLVPAGRTAVITFQAFSTESHHGWVMITCASGNNFTSPQYHGSQLPAVLTISSCKLVNVSFHTDGSTTNTYFSLTYAITSGIKIGGFTARPSNAFPLSYKEDAPIVFNCTTTTGYLPWWTFSDLSSNNYTVTHSTCGVVTSAPYSFWFRTESFGPGSCNLIVVAPASNLYLLAGSFICTDSTLASTRAIVVPINLELRSTTGTNSSKLVTNIIRDEEIRLFCNPSFIDGFSSPSSVFTYYLYNRGPVVQMRIFQTYWTSTDGSVIPSANNVSVVSNVLVVKAPTDGIIPQYKCNAVFDLYSNISDIFLNSSEIFSNISELSNSYLVEAILSVNTEPIEVLYWPTEDNMTIIGDNNGQIRTPALLHCNAAANPPATYTWVDESNGNVTNGPTITIIHGGRYTCNASNIVRGQYFHQSKSVNLQVLECETLQLSVSILATLLGVAVLTIIIILAFLFIQRKRNAENLGQIFAGGEHELGQRERRDNAYQAELGSVVDVAESENEDMDAIYENCVPGKQF